MRFAGAILPAIDLEKAISEEETFGVAPEFVRMIYTTSLPVLKWITATPAVLT